jgi:hypothetical protein
MRVANLAQRNGMNQIDMPQYQRGKRFLGTAQGIFPQQHYVVGRHLTHTFTLPPKRDSLFSMFQPLEPICSEIWPEIQLQNHFVN